MHVCVYTYACAHVCVRTSTHARVCMPTQRHTPSSKWLIIAVKKKYIQQRQVGAPPPTPQALGCPAHSTKKQTFQDLPPTQPATQAPRASAKGPPAQEQRPRPKQSPRQLHTDTDRCCPPAWGGMLGFRGSGATVQPSPGQGQEGGSMGAAQLLTWPQPSKGLGSRPHRPGRGGRGQALTLRA